MSKQYYYEPTVAHVSTREKVGYSNMLFNTIALADASGKSIGSLTTSNGVGTPLLMGPPFLPVVPAAVAGFFTKKISAFKLDLIVKSESGYFMLLAIDSVDFKRLNDSLTVRKVATSVDLPGKSCYLIINDSVRVPLGVREYFMHQTHSHSYRLYAPVRFRKVHSFKIVTGNPILDDRLNHVVFKRRKRITHSIFWLR